MGLIRAREKRLSRLHKRSFKQPGDLRQKKERRDQLSVACEPWLLAIASPVLEQSGLHPGQHVFGKQCPSAIVLRRIALFVVRPAIGGEVVEDFGFELDLSVRA